MSFVLLALAAALLGFWFWIYWNSLLPHPLPVLPKATGAQRPRVTIVVAMRNEAARCLPESVPSILQQLGVGDELIFVDDHSTDDTAAMVSSLIATDPRARVLSATAAHKGKREALALGAATAKNPFLLFIDADVIVAHDAARRVLETASRDSIDCISIFPQTVAISFWERIALVATSWVLYAGNWFRRTNDNRHPVGLGATGVFILVRRETYSAIGGYEAVTSNVLEDIAFANRIREQGHRYRYFRADGLVKHRMYRSLGEIVDGMAKNTFPALGGDLWIALAAGLGLSLVLVGPPLLFVASMLRPFLVLVQSHRFVWLAIIAVSGMSLPWMWLGQASASRLMGTAPGAIATALSPLGAPVWLWILARSIYMNRIRERVWWRGRFIQPHADRHLK